MWYNRLKFNDPFVEKRLPMEQKKILVVDDNSLSRSILKRLFEKEYFVLQAENGKDALELFREHYETMAAVLLDIHMPKFDGMYFLERLNAQYKTSTVPIIVISGDDREDVMIQAYHMGVTTYIHKPFNTEHVRRVVHAAVKKAEEKSSLHTEYDNMSMLSHLMQVLNRCHKDNHAFHTALEIVGAYLGADRVSLYMKPMQAELYQWRKEGVANSYRHTYRWMLEHDWCIEWSAPEEWLLYIGPEYGSHKQYKYYYRKYGIRAMQCLKIQGVRPEPTYLIIENPSRVNQDISLYGALLSCFSLAVKTVELGIVDQKTGVYNRQFCSDYLRYLRRGPTKSLGLILMNLNSMNQYITTYGQDAGDDLLQRTADIICRYAGPTCFRTGGDEFTAVLENVTREETESIMERIGNACKEQNIGLSLGCDWRDRSIDPEDMLRTADQRMREAKSRHYSTLNVTTK